MRRPRRACERGVHHERADAIGVVGRELHARDPAERVGEQRGAFAARRFEHRQCILGILLE